MFKSVFFYKNYNTYLFLVFILWIISITSYFFLNEFVKAGGLENGVKYGTDTHFYLNEVKKILNETGSFLDVKSKFGFILFLTPFVYFDIPFIFIVFFQLILTAFSALCLYKITSKFFCKASGVICVALFLFYFPIQIRNFYILTEMLFIDIVIIISYLIVFYKRIYLPLIILLILVLISLRPNGILYLFSIIFCSIIYFIKLKRYLYLIIYFIFVLILWVPIINLLNSYLVDLNLIDGISNKGIIWGWSFEEDKPCRVSCLGVELINENYKNNVTDILKFIFRNFINFFKIFLLKVFWLLARVRPYYSDLHNYYILIFNLLFYLGFLYGFTKRPIKSFSVNIIVMFILLSITLVGLTFADWSGRFSLYFLPLIMIFSSYGILIFFKNFFSIFLSKKL